MDGPAWAVFNVQIAKSGQSTQFLLFCSSGQQGISAVMDISNAFAIGEATNGAGAPNGASVKPRMTNIASAMVRSRRKFIRLHLTRPGTLEASIIHICASTLQATRPRPRGIVSLLRDGLMTGCCSRPKLPTQPSSTARLASLRSC